MRAYKSIFKIRFINTLQYRTAAIAGVLTQFAWGLMYIMLYKAFYSQGNIPDNFSLQQMVGYIWLQQMFFVYFATFDRNKEIIGQIEQGNICYEMVRPINLYANWFTTVYAEKISKTLLRFVPVLIFSILLPAGWGIGLPDSIWAFLLSIFNIVLGGMLTVALSLICYCLLFQTMSSLGVFSIFSTIASLLGGSLIPIPLTPVWFQKLLNFFPFRYISDLPFRTYVGSIPLTDALIQTGVQVTWVVLFMVLGNLYLKHNLKKVEVQGG